MSVTLHGPFESEEELLRQLVENAWWGVLYHEQGLAAAGDLVAPVKTLLQKAGLRVDDLEEAQRFYNESDEADIRDAQGLAVWLVGKSLSGIRYHEEELRKALRTLGLVRALVVRLEGIYDIRMDACEAAARKRLEPDAE